MAKTDIGPKIGIDGEAQFRRELNEINQGMKVLDSEAKAVAAAMKDETDAEKKSAAQKDVLNRQILSQKEKLEKLKEGLEASAKKFGEADTRTQKWQKAVYDATADLANMEHELKDLDGSIDEATDSMQEGEKAAGGWADVMKGQLCADTVKAGLQMLAKFAKEVAGALWDASKAGAEYADTYNTMAATTGLSTDTLQEYAYMADLIEVSMDTLTGAQTKMLNSMRKAKDGTGDAAEAWGALGVNIANADGSLRDTENVLNETLAALRKIENETERDAAAMAIFGKSAQELNPMILAGADELEKLRKEAHDTGYVLSGASLTALNKQQDAMDRFAKKTEAVGNAFAAKMAPGIEKAYSTMGDAFSNPRVERGISIVSEGIGNIISGAADLAAKVLPGLFSVFSFGDERLRLYNDAQLELANRLDEQKAAHEAMMATYKENASAIVEETERTEGLWKELQKLVGENGNVQEADQARVDFILNQLNEALGTEYTRNGDLIEQYQEMQEEIDTLIKKREAEALISAGADDFAEAKAKQKEALDTAAQYYAQIAEAEAAVDKARTDLLIAQSEARNAPGYAYKGEQYVTEQTVMQQKALNDAREALSLIRQEYEDANKTAAEYYETVDRWERAQSAALQGNYRDVVRILADEFGVTLDYYRQKKQLNEQEKTELKEKIKAQELTIAEYKRNLERGLTGFSEEGLAELQSYVDEAKAILDGKEVADHYIDGLIYGLTARRQDVYNASKNVANTVTHATKQTLQIASPSKVATWMGEMYDAGLIRGVENKEDELRRAVEGLSETMINANLRGAASLSTSAYNGVMAAPIGTYGGAGSTNAYTTNLGGINITISNAAGLNEQLLAQEIAAQLTHELQSAQRGGRF